MSSRQLAYVQKRRSTRIYNSIPLAIQGANAFRAPYAEQVSTLTVNCHGCRYRSNYEVIQGDTVYLEVKPSPEARPTYSCQAKVKWVQRLMTKDSRFEIAVELEAPGNIWGIQIPPEDWFPADKEKAPFTNRESARPEQPLATRREQPAAAAFVNDESFSLSALDRDEQGLGAVSPAASQLMAGLGKQIQAMVSQAASAAFVKERERLLADFRAQLQDEASTTIQRVMKASQQELTRRVLTDLSEAHEAAARMTYERWNKKMEQDTKNAAQCLVAHAMEVNRRIEGLTAATMERLQSKMETSRSEAIERFLARLREHLTPLLENAQVTMQALNACEQHLKEEALVIREQFDAYSQEAIQGSISEAREKALGMLNQFESDATKKLAESEDDLNGRSLEIVAETSRILKELSQGTEETVQGQLRLLVSSAADDVTRVLKDRSIQISRQFSSQLESSTRTYLEKISDSIAEVSKKTVLQSGN